MLWYKKYAKDRRNNRIEERQLEEIRIELKWGSTLVNIAFYLNIYKYSKFSLKYQNLIECIYYGANATSKKF